SPRHLHQLLRNTGGEAGVVVRLLRAAAEIDRLRQAVAGGALAARGDDGRVVRSRIAVIRGVVAVVALVLRVDRDHGAVAAVTAAARARSSGARSSGTRSALARVTATREAEDPHAQKKAIEWPSTTLRHLARWRLH